MVDEYCHTSVPDVYATGDVTETVNPLTGEHQLNPTWINAAFQGRAAGMNMAGIRVPISRRARLNVVNLLGLPIASIGLVPESERYLTTVSRDGSQYRCFYFDDERMVGALLVGDVNDAGIIGHMVERQVSYPKRIITYFPLNIQSQFYASIQKI